MSESTPRISAATLARRLGPQAAGGTGPAYRQLAHRIRSAVLDGRLAVTSGLPSERDLAAGLSLSRTTVAAAYTLLRDEGWLDSRRGSGSRLRLPDATARAGHGVQGLGPAGLFGYPAMAGDDAVDLSTASLPAPVEALQRAGLLALQDLPDYAAGDGYAPFGLPVLRQAIADHYRASGVPTTPEQILVTSGAQHAFVLALHELSAPGDRVMIECPTYPVALDAIRAAGRVPGPIGLPGPQTSAPERDSGPLEPAWDADLMCTAMRQTAPSLAYLMPDFQNPTGAVMDQTTRESIVRGAQRNGTLLLIDESFRDVPFPHSPALPPRMSALDVAGLRVLSLGSLSKSVWGGLRIGWIRAAPALINRLAAARALGDMSGPVVDQLIAAHFLDDPELAFGRAAPAAGRRRRRADRDDGFGTTGLAGQSPGRWGQPVGRAAGAVCLGTGPPGTDRRCPYRPRSAFRAGRNHGVLSTTALHPAAGEADQRSAPARIDRRSGSPLATVGHAGLAGLILRAPGPKFVRRIF